MRTPLRRPGLLAAAVLGWLASLAAPAPAQNVVPEDGLFVSVRSPITSEVVSGVKSQVQPRVNDPARPVRTVVFDFNPDGKDAANTDFGACWGLAKFIGGLKGSTATVAFVHGKATGHTVLPVLACGELVMARGAAVGGVVGDGVPPLDRVDAVAYQEIAEGRRGLTAVVQKMYDKDIDLARGLSKQDRVTRVYVNRANKEDAARATNLEEVPFAPPGQVVVYAADQARDVGLCKALADTRAEVAELYNMPPASAGGDPLAGRQPEPFRYTLSGEVDGSMREALVRVLRDVKRKKGNVLLLTIACSGPDLEAGRRIADDLIEAQTGEDAIKVIGFVPDEAPAAAAFVALGCTELVMSKRRDAAGDEPAEAVLGDFAGYIEANRNNPGAVEANRRSLRELAEKRGYPGILVDGLFDRELVIERVRGTKDRTRRRLMTPAEREADKANWVAESQVKPKGQYLKLTATLAAEVGVARYAVESRDPAAVYALYGLDPAKVKEVTPGWLDRFAEFLRIPVVTVLLVLIGFTGLILELKLPGLTVPGIVAALAFILFFWSQSRFSGEMFVLALLLFVMGLVLVGLEIFVLPGFGAPGIFGVMCMLGGLGLVTLEKLPESGADWGLLGFRVVQYVFGMIGATGLAFGIARFLPNVPYANRLLLAPPDDHLGGDELPGAGAAAGLLGAIGTASTPLRPAGVVRVGDVFADVVSDGGFIPAGTRVQVIAVEGTRVVVKEV